MIALRPPRAWTLEGLEEKEEWGASGRKREGEKG